MLLELAPRTGARLHGRPFAMRLEQAIFTSVRSERLDGYQLAARSGGVSDELAKELTAWGPAHDSLWDTRHPDAQQRQLPSACRTVDYCVSQTTLAGAEYSGRGGGRVYTQMFVLPARRLLNALRGDPFLVLRALVGLGPLGRPRHSPANRCRTFRCSAGRAMSRPTLAQQVDRESRARGVRRRSSKRCASQTAWPCSPSATSSVSSRRSCIP